MNTSPPPADLPPLPANTYYGGTLADYEEDVEGYAWHPGMIDKWNHGDSEPCPWKGMAMYPDASSAKWHVALPIPAEQPSPPPCDANVAGSDLDAIQTTNKACPAGFDKLDDSGRGGFLVEVGKTYINRDGFRVAIRRGEGTILYPLRGETLDGPHAGDTDGYTVDGSFEIGKQGQYDLIAPWIDWKAECEKAQKLITLIIENSFFGTSTGYQHVEPLVIRDAKDYLASLKGEGAGA